MRTQKRPGVLLLIVLALLAMFGVMAIAFVILAGTTRRGADALRKVGQYDDQPEKVLNQAALDLFRGSNNHQSPLQAHGLLENLYGNEWFTGTISIRSTVTTPPGGQLDGPIIGQGQLIQFSFTSVATGSAITNPERFLGAVLSLTFQPASATVTNSTNIAGTYSTHIVGGWDEYTTAATPVLVATHFQIAAFEGLDSSDVVAYINQNANNSNPPVCLINGMPYSGTGFGFNPTAATTTPTPPSCYNTATDTNPSSGSPPSPAPVDSGVWPFALLPNHAAFPYTSNDPCYNPNSTYSDPAGPGGANPDYTAADYQNMFLALRLAQAPQFPASWTGSNINNNFGRVPLPSFHRPDLVYYWQNWKNPNTGNVDWFDDNLGPILQRKVLLRSLGQVKTKSGNVIVFNPGIVTANPNFDPVNGPWDVDNDGDGIADSVWIDPGYEVRSTPDGRLYKPLVAILCVDLDGRLNLNAHGSVAQLLPDFYQSTGSGSTLLYGGNPSNVDVKNGNGQTAVALPHGHMGWGPADINLAPLFANNMAEYPSLLKGNGNVYGRYVSNPVSGSAVDDLDANKEFDYPYSYLSALGANATGTTGPMGYGTPPDLQGLLAVGVDLRGQPFYGVPSGGTAVDPITNNPGGTWSSSLAGCYSALAGNWNLTGRAANPYELDLSLGQPRGVRPSAPYSPFSVAELEPILRPFDRDAMSLPPRLLLLAPLSLGNVASGVDTKVTTDSWDLPCPSLAAPVSNLGAFSTTANAPTSLLCYTPGSDGRIRHFTDLLKAVVNATAYGGTSSKLTPTNIASVLPPDLLSGLRMDINRPFGNGYADYPNGTGDTPQIVSYPGVVNAGTEKMPYTTPPAPGTNGTARMDFADSGDSSTVADPRQMLFRYLYVLGMVLTDPAATPPSWNSTLPPTLGTMYAASGPEARARWIAQWAANVVSFRDRDSIIKPFVYDPNVLSNLAKGKGWSPDDPVGNNGQYVVFSCERPELLITETLAFHQTRTEVFDNPKHDTDPTAPKSVLLQRMRPQGSLYIELYNPWSATEAPSAEFYYDRTNTTTGWQEGVVLNQRTPATATTAGDPVWRLIIPQDGTNIQTDPDGYNSGNPPLTIARSIYFTKPSFSVAGTVNDGIEFYPSDGANSDANKKFIPPIVLHNHYALIGPPSSEISASPAGTWLSKPSSGNPAEIVLDPTKYDTTQNPGMYQTSSCPVQILNNNPTAATPNTNDLPVTQLKQPLPIVIDQSSAGDTGPRLSISEPSAGYPATTGTDDVTKTNDGVYATTTPPKYAATLYQPLDGTTAPSSDAGQAAPIGSTHQELIGGVPVGTLSASPTPACRVVHLQRLANPLMPYQPLLSSTTLVLTADGQIDWTKTTYNPYITIDSMPIDLNIYNGWTSANDPQLKQLTPDGSDVKIEPIPKNNAFKSRQRGDALFWGNSGTITNILWAQEWPNADSAYSTFDPTLLKLTNQTYPYPLMHTLGYINYGYWGTFSASKENPPQYTAPSHLADYQGDPTNGIPFPWLTWNNRPFCSPLELMLVPATSPSQLLYSYAIPNVSPADANSPYGLATAPATATSNNLAQPYAHLLNFFYLTQPQDGKPTATSPAPPQFYRMLEYLRVPSRFVGTEVQTSLATDTSSTLPSGATNPNYNQPFSGDGSGTHQFHPPYNRISRYRDPGRMNLNTITDPDVWNGLMQNAAGLNVYPPVLGTPSTPSTYQAFNDFLFSRRGYLPGAQSSSSQFNYWDFFNPTVNTTATPNVVALNSAYPSIFANPFRSFSGSHFVPLPVLAQGADINSTLLRQSPNNSNRALFSFDSTVTGSGGSNRQYNNDERNPYFRYQNLQRLGNLTTTRSNVFAVWITVGYFQVQKAPTLSGNLNKYQQFFYPDGYQIVGELGADTGEVKRHRAFYIFDRSIPMGFQRGRDNNVNNGILVSRMIE